MIKLIRYIEEFNNSDDRLHHEYELEISVEQILTELDDLILNKDDYPNEIYDPYLLTNLQVEKLKSFLKQKNSLKQDFHKYSYFLSCYEENNIEELNL
ncbi:hypothetical protein [Empedobacter brevis]|uniref:DUF7683 domain-containing protein n=1 Tax=Empedobacter brevis TaxID=247 RepID=UPI0039AFFE17